ncbi:MG2 domain-containing protein [Caldimonas brevitalea]|uniref:Alpha-2-macroglobulin domain protein n=1 Tax=Caldimonas brevitalea TaxID=413882 RepID=A0A0G3BKC5_9BURK|nr:MG2 domain-containing protein [Caldimonas brevitalea]AKJ29914.1 alpha-2-macroglobulin domain protein [Caldimonas brevitalea]
MISIYAISRRSTRPALRYDTALLALLLAALCSLLATGAALADDEDTGYMPPRGVPFFLLTDTSFASSDEARVRLEVTGEQLAEVEHAGGADIALYRVERPLEFLRQQRNLHRIDLKAAARPEGLANTLSYLWDRWWLRARQIWQNLFKGELRVKVTEQAPQLKTSPDIGKPTAYTYTSAYRSLPGLAEVQRMRYPVAAAKPIAPPSDLKLSGSSSEFRPPEEGNVYIPLGRQQPGLYVVEAAVGRHRAVTLLFVSDTVAVTKTSGRQFLIWTAQRADGRPAQAEVVWTDLAGVLGSGRTDAHGVLALDHAVPQTSYAFGVDAQGGVFVTENFYYDSEIYNAKLYAYTDRPLYRPGDEVNIRLYGREFTSATRSTALPAAPVELQVMDATGALVHRERLAYHPQDGAAARLRLPANAPAGGYEIVLTRGEDSYSAAFRVAPYVKPHFEVLVEPAQASFKTGEKISGRIRLAYPDGKPVAKASLRLSARAQVLTMVECDLLYGGLFPLQIANDKELHTDADGVAAFELPPAKEPSRLVLSVLASDGAAQRVKATREILIERAASAWTLQPQRRYAAPAETVTWSLKPDDDGAAQPSKPTAWLAIHQESQTRTQGTLAPDAQQLTLKLERPGSYTVELRDEQQRLLGAAPFWVSGGELKPPQGAIEIVLDKPRYRPGDTARALITFPVPVEDALVTLERDRVEHYGRLLAPQGVANVRRLNERQWEATLQVKADHAPNISFSVAYVHGHEYGFQNAGVVVEQPALQVTLRTDRESYRPGETVVLEITTRDAAGKPAAAVLSIGAVDEMVYALQPELAPSLQEFFYHLRRNNVRTQSSLSFISFDEAYDARTAASIAGQRHERGVKLLERPRRDERDTAYFEPTVRTDANGRAQVRFKVPDALTRWRITAKGYGLGDADGLVGERRAFFLSDQPYFAKWTAPTWAREGDRPQATVAVFNQTRERRALKLSLGMPGAAPLVRELDAAPGATFVALDLPPLKASTEVTLDVHHGSERVDTLTTRLSVVPREWRGEQELMVPVPAGSTSTPLALPADATGVRLRVLPTGVAAWTHVADGLIEQPHDGVEHTASRIVPLALALQSLSADVPPHSPLRQRLYAARLRLAALAGPNAVFGWWGQGSSADSAFWSAYAYHADHLATRALGMELPAAHWERLLDIYSEKGGQEPLAQRAWALWLMHRMGLPTATMTEGLLAELAQGESEASAAPTAASAASSPTVAPPRRVAGGHWFTDATAGRDLALVVTAQLARAHRKELPPAVSAGLEAAYARLETSEAMLSQALLVWSGRRPAQGDALAAALARASQADAGLDRTLALIVLSHTSGLSLRAEAPADAPKAGWTARASASGQSEWVPAGRELPTAVEWAQPTAQPLMLSVRLQGRVTSPRNTLPAQLQRRLYRLQPQGASFEPVLVKPGDALSSRELYLDEVTVVSKQTLSFALAELALPPGASLEPSTWGIRLKSGGAEPAALDRAIAEATSLGYSLPVDSLPAGESRVFRHLVRFAQQGRFQLPAARLWRVYQPRAQAVEAAEGGGYAWQVR